MAKTYQTVARADETWVVFCLEAGKDVAERSTKAEAVALVATLNQAPGLLASAKMVVEACNPLPLNAAQHMAFAHLTNAIAREEH